MRPHFPKLRQPRGWTLIELMIVVGVMGIILPTTIRFFSKASEGMAADEMHMHLKKVNQETLLRLNVRIKSNKHMFRSDTSGVTFLGCILNGTPAPPAPAVPVTLPGTQPDNATLGSELVPTFSITRGAAPTSFGNQLFFAAYDSPGTILFNAAAQTFTAPMTVVTKSTPVGGTPVTYGTGNGGGPATIILDVYRFYRYYPTTSIKPLTTIKDGPTASITSGAMAYGLVEWRSVQFVDFNQLSSIGDTTLRNRVVQWLSKSSSPTNFPGAPITLAYNPSQTDPTAAFYNLNFAVGTFTAMSPPRIPQASWSILTKASSGMLSNGFRYGIAPNTAGWRNAPPATAAAPQYATASTTYPGGFEVGLIGSSAGVQVLTRCLLVARGAVRQTIYNDLTMVHNAKDAW